MPRGIEGAMSMVPAMGSVIGLQMVKGTMEKGFGKKKGKKAKRRRR